MVDETHFPSVVSRVESLVAEGVFATGAQIAVRSPTRGLQWDHAAGTCGDHPVRVESLHNVYCLTKPLLPLALAHLDDDSGIDYQAPLERLGPATTDEDHRPTTIAQVLTHEAGLQEPTAALWRLTPRRDRQDLFRTIQQPSPAYSEVHGWAMLDQFVESRSGTTSAEYITDRVLNPLGIDGLVLQDAAAEAAFAAGAVLVPIGGLPQRRIPMLSEVLPAQQGASTGPVFGAYASMAALADVFAAVLRVIGGQPVAGMPSTEALDRLVSIRRPSVFDSVLRRECSFAGGMMHGASSMQLEGLLGETCLGHTAGITDACVIADPEKDLVVALYLNGFSADGQDHRLTRRSIVSELLDELT